MSEKNIDLQKETQDYEDIIAESLDNLNKAQMALDILTEEYDWNYNPDARKAFKFANTVNAKEKCTDEEYFSWKYLCDYKKIMFLIHIASDYCQSALEVCKEVYEGGASV